MVAPRCPCKKKKNQSPALQCTLCEQWWHSCCVSLEGLTTKELSNIISWKCPLCYVLPSAIPNGRLETLVREESNVLKLQVKAVEASVQEDKLKTLMSEVVKKHLDDQVKSVCNLITENSVDTRRVISERIQKNNTEVVDQVVRSSKSQMDGDNLAREQRKCNLVIRNVSEPDGDTGNERRLADEEFACRILNVEKEQIIKVARPGKPIGAFQNDTRVSRPLVITVETPEMAAYLHDYGRGWRRVADGGAVYWVNPDLIKSDREANYKARVVARTRRSGGMHVVDAVGRSPGSTRSLGSTPPRGRSLTNDSIDSTGSQRSHSRHGSQTHSQEGLD